MKRIIAVVIILAVIIIACTVGLIFIDKCCEDVISSVEYCSTQRNEESVENLNSSWQKYKNIMFVFLNHQEVEDIDMKIHLLKSFLDNQSNKYNTVCEEISYEMNRIKEDEKICIKNFF